ncbi:MAG: hypothetical protein NTX96_03495 [Candidatus Zambryskibacteria bacterium]|nr:hypothetical protein [Candidatus Zambryskibacteria bacterium]
MKKSETPIESFARCMSQRVTKIADRAVAFLYFYAVKKNCGASPKQIIADFDNAGLGSPNITKLKKALVKDRRTAKCSKDEWRLKNDKITEIEKELQLGHCLTNGQTKLTTVNGAYIDKKRFQALKKKSGKFDFSRLIKILEELDYAFSVENYISVILLVRAILDHIPPIFNLNTFAEVTNNYGTKSFKDSMSNLENSSRKIADSYLHTRIRKKESLPNKTQVNFSNDIDVLLAEIIRIS